MSDQCTHLVILRAADEDPEGANVQAKVGYTREPEQETLDKLREGLTQTFRNAFGDDPQRVGVAVLPWVGELDDE